MKMLATAAALAALVAYAQPPQDMNGFSGYAWGSGDIAIKADMERDGYEVVAITHNSAWYKGSISDYPCQFGYVFNDDGLLMGGAWIFEDTSEQAFRDIGLFLTDIYVGQEDIQFTVSNDGVFVEYTVSDVHITHYLNQITDEHEVLYRDKKED